jgi:low temperature requirement protein LtrA
MNTPFAHFPGHQLMRHRRGPLPPTRLRIGDGREREDRHSSWLELFFDLVFAAAVGQLAGALQHTPTTDSLLRFVGLFIPVWWTWLNFSIYADRHEAEDDPVHRAAFLLAGLLGVGLAIGADQAMHGHVGAFLVAFLALRALQMGLWARAHRQVPKVARLYRRHLLTFGAGGVLWAASLAAPETILPALWAAALAVELAGPVTAARKHMSLPLNPVHLTERLEIFVLIVLGESVTRLVSAATQRAWTPQLAVVLTAAFATITALWWISLRASDDRPIARGPTLGNLAYRLLCLPVVLSIAAASAGLHVAILAASGGTIGASARTALYGGTGVFLLAAAALPTGHAGRAARFLRLGAAGASLALVPMGSFVAPAWLVPALTAILIAEIAIETELARPSRRARPEQSAARVSQPPRLPALAPSRANHDPIPRRDPQEAASPARG